MGQRLAWSWTGAAFGAALAVPAAIVALFDVESGLAIATGMLPAAMLGLLPRRRARVLVVVLGALTGASIAVGGLLAGEPVLAVAAAVLFVDADPGAGWYAAAAVATLAGATATRASRWYVTAASRRSWSSCCSTSSRRRPAPGSRSACSRRPSA